MHTELLESLKAHRPNLRTRWEHKLRALPPSSAMAEPDALVHLMEWTLENFFVELTHKARRQQRHQPAEPCPCGMNPLIAYFVTAEDALLEIIFTEEKPWLALNPDNREAELAWIRSALQRVATREIGAFCAVCRHHKEPHPHAHDDIRPSTEIPGDASGANGSNQRAI